MTKCGDVGFPCIQTMELMMMMMTMMMMMMTPLQMS